MPFERNVFVNCPFDEAYYYPLLRPLLFTIIYVDLLTQQARDVVKDSVRLLAMGHVATPLQQYHP